MKQLIIIKEKIRNLGITEAGDQAVEALVATDSALQVARHIASQNRFNCDLHDEVDEGVRYIKNKNYNLMG